MNRMRHRGYMAWFLGRMVQVNAMTLVLVAGWAPIVWAGTARGSGDRSALKRGRATSVSPSRDRGVRRRAGKVFVSVQSGRVTPLLKRTYDIALSRGRFYLAVTGGLVVLKRNRCRNPKESHVGRCQKAAFVQESALILPDSANALALRGGRLVIAQGTWGLAVVDVRRPARPRLIAHLVLPGPAMGVSWHRKIVSVAMGAMGLAVVDMRRPTAPKMLGTVQVGGYAWSVAVSRGIGLVAAGRAGVVVLDLRRPSSVRVLARLDIAGEARETAFVDGKTAVVAAGKAGLVLVDLSSPSRPKILDRLPTEDFGRGVGVAGGVVAMAEGQSGAMLARVLGGRLKFLGRYSSRKLAVNDVSVRTKRDRVRLYLAHDAGGLMVVEWTKSSGDVIARGTAWPTAPGR